MSIEIERKFIVSDDKLVLNMNGSYIVQGYLSDHEKSTVRVRQIDHQGSLTIKSGDDTYLRDEFAYQIKLHEAKHMLQYVCLYSLIEKTRYSTKFADNLCYVIFFII